ncbi:hypothetical protein AXF42_Ash019082 [Apostasia shenzhenica]|uniref:Uncharacterized protein n=1 Tax=Apostasia shenzhenica TaxID=1088818 RepID=A0A2I0BBA4_9ASPA|nr:hypothetical protein AXF42_Ash019082 [Apostasia shenzhenica]
MMRLIQFVSQIIQMISSQQTITPLKLVVAPQSVTPSSSRKKLHFEASVVAPTSATGPEGHNSDSKGE